LLKLEMGRRRWRRDVAPGGRQKRGATHISRELEFRERVSWARKLKGVGGGGHNFNVNVSVEEEELADSIAIMFIFIIASPMNSQRES